MGERPNIEEKNPLKQGLKLVINSFNCITYRLIEEKNPLKQGLKQVSIANFPALPANWREESIKTRIETRHKSPLWRCKDYIEEKNPLKQGLKHYLNPYIILTAIKLKRRIH